MLGDSNALKPWQDSNPYSVTAARDKQQDHQTKDAQQHPPGMRKKALPLQTSWEGWASVLCQKNLWLQQGRGWGRSLALHGVNCYHGFPELSPPCEAGRTCCSLLSREGWLAQDTVFWKHCL